MVDVQTVTVVIAGISVIVGVINSILSSRQSAKNDQQMLETRQAQLFMQVYQRFNTTEMRRSLQRVLYEEEWKTYEDWQRKYKTPSAFNQSDAFVPITTVGSYFGGLGVFVEQGLLDPTMIDDLMGEYIIDFWEKTASVVMEIRKLGNPRYSDRIEYLYTVMKQRELQRATTSA